MYFGISESQLKVSHFGILYNYDGREGEPYEKNVANPLSLTTHLC